MTKFYYYNRRDLVCNSNKIRRYLFGEIMYGGHITDDWDRRLCVSYLEELMQPELIDGELMLAPGKRFICSFILIQYNPNVTRVEENHRRFPSAAQYGFSRVSRVHRRGDAPRITLPVRVASKRGNRLLDHDRGKFVQNGVRDATEGRGQLRQSNGDQRGKGNFDRTSERREERRDYFGWMFGKR